MSRPVGTAVSPPGRVDGRADWRLLLAVSITVVAWASAFVVIRYVGPDFSRGR